MTVTVSGKYLLNFGLINANNRTTNITLNGWLIIRPDKCEIIDNDVSSLIDGISLVIFLSFKTATFRKKENGNRNLVSEDF